MRSALIRVDASPVIGYGHIVRCLTLARSLNKRGVKVTFACALDSNENYEILKSEPVDAIFLSPFAEISENHENPLSADLQIKDAENLLEKISETFDIVIIDHYGLDIVWERCIRKITKKLVVINDFVERTHECDALIDSGLSRKKDSYIKRYGENIPSLLLVGGKFAMIRDDFKNLKAKPLNKNQPIKLLIAMGSGDFHNITTRVLDILHDAEKLSRFDLHLCVVLPNNSPWTGQVKDRLSRIGNKSKLHVGADNMAELMADCHVAIGSGGVMALERCCLGLPSIVVVRAENQRANANALGGAGAAIVVGGTDPVHLSQIPSGLEALLDEEIHAKMRSACLKLVDTHGAERISEEIVSDSRNNYSARTADWRDCELLFEWANDSQVRANAFNSNTIVYERHCEWFLKRCGNPDEVMIYIVESPKTGPIGQVRFELNQSGTLWELDYSLAKGFRGLDLSSLLLRLALEKFYETRNGSVVSAQVKAINIQSIKALEKVGFVYKTRRSEDVFEYQMQLKVDNQI